MRKSNTVSPVTIVCAIFSFVGCLYGIATSAVTFPISGVIGAYAAILPGVVLGFLVAKVYVPKLYAVSAPIIGSAMGYFAANFLFCGVVFALKLTLSMALGAYVGAGIFRLLYWVSNRRLHLMCV